MSCSDYHGKKITLTEHCLTLGRPRREQTASASVFPELPCNLCRRLSPRSEVERLGGFCSERHKWDWLVVIILPLFGDRQLITIRPDHSRESSNQP